MAEARILMVDDTPSVSRVMAALLERCGYLTISVDRSQAALELLRNDPEFDLVLSDVMMPDGDGFALLDRIGVEHPGLPVVMVTAVHDIHVAMNAFRRGAMDYLLKPFERGHLLNVVERAVEQGRLRKQSALYQRNLEEVVLARTARLRSTMLDLERSYDTTLEVMSAALDLRDSETEGHSRRVTAYTIALAREMGVNEKELAAIARGAFLHDIGKIATPDAVLLKPGKLDPAETAIMREHCDRGYSIVNKIPFLQEASEIVLTHQEAFDGSGYPQRLKEQEIPLGSRIFAIADTMDAITSDRPYRKRATFETAKEEISRCSGQQFDPAIVEVFQAIPVLRWTGLRTEITDTATSSVLTSLFKPTRTRSPFAHAG